MPISAILKKAPMPGDPVLKDRPTRLNQLQAILRAALCLALLQPYPLFALAWGRQPVPSPLPSPGARAPQKILQAGLDLPLCFEENTGQVRTAGPGRAVPQVRFLAR